MARGCIPIVFNSGGLTEIVENEKNGYIIENVNSESLYKKLKELFKENAIMVNYKDVQKRAKNFNIEQSINKLKEEYSKLTSKGEKNIE